LGASEATVGQIVRKPETNPKVREEIIAQLKQLLEDKSSLIYVEDHNIRSSEVLRSSSAAWFGKTIFDFLDYLDSNKINCRWFEWNGRIYEHEHGLIRSTPALYKHTLHIKEE
jgi:hypothetical protein